MILPDKNRRQAKPVLHRLLLAALFCFAFSHVARADYELCNATSYVLDAARGHEDAQGWKSEGWLRLLPGSCGTLATGPIADGDTFIFARSIDAHRDATKYFSGTERFCTLPETFSIAGRESCGLRGYESYDFIRVTTKSGNDWTTTLREAQDYSLNRAQLAGAQRLLKDIGEAEGLKIAKIDGIATKSTLEAIRSFRQSRSLNANGPIDETLLGALAASAERAQEKTGLNLCNRTQHLVWASIAQEYGEKESGERVSDMEAMSSGWIRIAPQSCRKAVKGPLDGRGYHVYAEAIDDKGAPARADGRLLLWTGKESFCIKPTRFEIRGREGCLARGFEERKFRPVDTGGKEFFEMILE